MISHFFRLVLKRERKISTGVRADRTATDICGISRIHSSAY